MSGSGFLAGPGVRRNLFPLAVAVLLTVWAQRHSLSFFFSSPDDFVHLQQAVGLKPILHSPFRFLSQVLYFKAMVRTVGLNPLPYHLVSLLVHCINLVLLFRFLCLNGASPGVAGLATSLFGTFPLFFPLLASAVGMNDEMALGFTLVALLIARLEGVLPVVASAASFVTAILCKESVLSLPLLTFAMRLPEPHRWARRVTLIAIGLVFSAALLVVPPQGLSPYATRFGPNVFHNLMTYLSWAVNVVRPIPDLVSSYDTTAWRVGIIVCGVILVAWKVWPRARRLIGFGSFWWVAGLLPVLILRFQTYRHYLYPALPGLSLVAGTVIASAVSTLTRARPAREEAGRATERPVEGKAVLAILAVLALVYAIRADSLITARIRARVPGTLLALDPVVRRQEVARNALASLAGSLPARSGVRVALFTPEGTGRVFGARTGRQYAGTSATSGAYSLIGASLDGGGAVRLFFPGVDSVAFIARWTPDYADHELFLTSEDGRLLPVGSGVEAHKALGRWLLERGLYLQSRDYLAEVLIRYPEDADIRLLYASALFKGGDRATALQQLGQVAKAAPQTDAGKAAATLMKVVAADSAGRQRH